MIMPLSRADAEAAVLHDGWLAFQPPAFQTALLSRALLQTWAHGEAIYRFGDPPGGIYGLVRGTLSISMAPRNAAPRFVQFGIAGAWAGEGPFLTGEPRRAEMRAVDDCALFHLPLDAMHRMAAVDPEAIRRFAGITVLHFDVLARVIDDLLIPNAARRIASVLHRASWLQSRSVPISQETLGDMANASRKQVNVALARFAREGWVATSYRAIEVIDAPALLRFAHRE